MTLHRRSKTKPRSTKAPATSYKKPSSSTQRPQRQRAPKAEAANMTSRKRKASDSIPNRSGRASKQPKAAAAKTVVESQQQPKKNPRGKAAFNKNALKKNLDAVVSSTYGFLGENCGDLLAEARSSPAVVKNLNGLPIFEMAKAHAFGLVQSYRSTAGMKLRELSKAPHAVPDLDRLARALDKSSDPKAIDVCNHCRDLMLLLIKKERCNFLNDATKRQAFVASLEKFVGPVEDSSGEDDDRKPAAKPSSGGTSGGSTEQETDSESNFAGDLSDSESVESASVGTARSESSNVASGVDREDSASDSEESNFDFDPNNESADVESEPEDNVGGYDSDNEHAASVVANNDNVEPYEEDNVGGYDADDECAASNVANNDDVESDPEDKVVGYDSDNERAASVVESGENNSRGYESDNGLFLLASGFESPPHNHAGTAQHSPNDGSLPCIIM